MKITAILEIPWVWKLYRKTIDFFFGVYRKRFSIIRNFGLTNQMSVLDVCCGTGEYSQLTDAAYLGVDLDARYIQDAQKRYGAPNKKFIHADANCAPIADRAYKAAILIDATHHLSDDENRRLIKTLNRAANRIVIICDPLQQSKNNLIGRFLAIFERGQYLRSKESLLKIIGESLKVEKVVETKIMGAEGVCVLARPL